MACFFYTPREVCRSCIFLIFSAFHHYWWPLTLLLVKKRFFRISHCLVMCKRDFKMQNRQLYVVFSQCLKKFSLINAIKNIYYSAITTHSIYVACNLAGVVAYKFACSNCACFYWLSGNDSTQKRPQAGLFVCKTKGIFKPNNTNNDSFSFNKKHQTLQ